MLRNLDTPDSAPCLEGHHNRQGLTDAHIPNFLNAHPGSVHFAGSSAKTFGLRQLGKSSLTSSADVGK